MINSNCIPGDSVKSGLLKKPLGENYNDAKANYSFFKLTSNVGLVTQGPCCLNFTLIFFYCLLMGGPKGNRRLLNHCVELLV